MALWDYVWAWSGVTLWLYRLNWNSNDSSWNGKNWTDSNMTYIGWVVWSWAWSFNWSSSTITTWTWFGMSTSAFTISCWFKPSSVPTWATFRWIVRIANSSNQNLWYLSLYQWKYYVIAGVWWINWVLQPTTPVPVVWVLDLLTLVETWTWLTLYRNGISISTWWSWTYSGTVDRFQISFWDYVDWLVDEVIIENRAWSVAEIQRYYTYAKWRYVL